MSVLRIEHLNKSFGSLVVTDDFNLVLPGGERHVIIGPNGAGKTSLINQIGGQLQPSSGRIFVKGRDVTGFSPSRISRMGVARTFQRNNLFQNLSVIENLRLALEVGLGNPLDFLTPVGRNQTLIERAAELMAQVHLAGDGARIARNLSYGEQRQLEIGIALAGEPELLLLDEPTSGMSPAETAQMIELIGSLPRTLSILMIEHDMNVVFSVADRITVLYYGKVARERPSRGDPGERARPRSLSRDDRTDARARERQCLLRRQPHPAWGIARGTGGRGGLPAWAKRRRQNHDHPHRHGLLAPAARTHPLRRSRYRCAPSLPRRAAGLRIRAAGARYLSKPDRPREPDDFCPQRRQRLLDLAEDFRAVPAASMPASAISASSYPAASNRCCQSLAR